VRLAVEAEAHAGHAEDDADAVAAQSGGVGAHVALEGLAALKRMLRRISCRAV